jgi:hypothetical protein
MARKRQPRASSPQTSRSELSGSDLSNVTFRTESDVEQKFLKPLLSDPAWLGYDEDWIHTKEYFPQRPSTRALVGSMATFRTIRYGSKAYQLP